MDARELRLQLEEKRMPNKMLQRDKDWLSKMLSEHLELQVGQESKDLQRIHHRILGSNPPEQPGGSVGSTRQPGTKRDVEQAGLSSDPMEDVETSHTNVLLSQRQGFLGAVYAQVEQSPETLTRL